MPTQPAVPHPGGYPPGGYPQAYPHAGFAVPSGVRPPVPKPTTPDGQPLAEFTDRLLAFLVDLAVLFVVSLILVIPAVIGMFVVLSGTIGKIQYDADGNAINEPSPAAVILPLLAIYGGVLILTVLFSYLYEVEHALRRQGTTWGKRVMKIRIVPLGDSTAPLTRGVLQRRWLVWYVLGAVVPFFRWIDGLWQVWDQPYKQCLHDKWAGTVVVKVRS
jgi:uncharacterized RDD family membrane protein YckC